MTVGFFLNVFLDFREGGREGERNIHVREKY